ncbi:MAG: hypothetical protein IJ327_00225 [Lachnospiraceae bacterium]|nr:hypothetical protein [Lachnospiraceae bacterium]
MDKKRTSRGENWSREYEEDYSASSGSTRELSERMDQPMTTFLVFVGMVLVAALLCVIIWAITHRKDTTVVLPTNESSVVDYVGTTDTTEESESTEEEEMVDDSNVVLTSDGREVVFTDCDNTITPKEYVNLRTEPSTAGGTGTVYCQADAGEMLHRTGISPDFGWSRIEYGDQILYVVTSNVEVVEE